MLGHWHQRCVPSLSLSLTSSSSRRPTWSPPPSSLADPAPSLLGRLPARRTWDFAAAMNATGALECFAAVSDLQDALVVLKAAIEPADVLVRPLSLSPFLLLGLVAPGVELMHALERRRSARRTTS